MPFYNIFSKKQSKEKPENKIKIIADNREKNSLVISELIALGINIELKQLEIADYLVNDVAIERKTLSDLQSSIINKRIFFQLNNLKQYSKNLLIIEGSNKEAKLYIHENALRGFLLSVALDYQIPLMYSSDEKDTAKYLSLLARKTPLKESSLRQSISFRTKAEQIQYILEGFPNIGPTKAKKLIEKFRSLLKTITAREEDLTDILGKKSAEFRDLIEGNV